MTSKSTFDPILSPHPLAKRTTTTLPLPATLPTGKLKSQRQLFGGEEKNVSVHTPSTINESIKQKPSAKEFNPYQTPLTIKQVETVVQLYSEKRNQFNMTPKSKMYAELDCFKCDTPFLLAIKITQIMRSFFASEKSLQLNDYRIFSEVAEMAKRNHFYTFARYLAQVSVFLQPFQLESWHCWARAEEELGFSKQALMILIQSLKFIKFSESTLSFITRLLEKAGEPLLINSVFMSLVNQGTFDQIAEQQWKIKLFSEWGVFLEQQGNVECVDYLYQKLQQACSNLAKSSNQGIIIQKNQQKFQLEFQNNLLESIRSTKQLYNLNNSLQQFSLAFGIILNTLIESNKCTLTQSTNKKIYLFLVMEDQYYLNLFETLDSNYKTQINLAFFLSYMNITNDKFIYDYALQITLNSIYSSPMIEKWKPIIIYCKIIAIYDLPKSIELLNKFITFFKPTTKSYLILKMFYYRVKLLEDAQVSSYQISQLSSLLPQFQSEWKLYFQLILLFLHSQMIELACKLAKQAVQQFPTSGRLWALLIHIEFILEAPKGENRISNAFKLFQLAIKHVPKSGEVWCEGIRLYMDPNQSIFSLKEAEKCMQFALRLTPQYGDSYIEGVKLYGLQQNLTKIKELKNLFLGATPTYGLVWHFLKDHDYITQRLMWKRIKSVVKESLGLNIKCIQRRDFSVEQAKEIYVTKNIQLNSKILQITAVPSFNRFVVNQGQNARIRQKIKYFLNQDLLLAV